MDFQFYVRTICRSFSLTSYKQFYVLHVWLEGKTGLESLPGKRGWQTPVPAVCTPPWPPWFPSCRCTRCPTPESHSSLPGPPLGPHKGYGRRLTEAESKGEPINSTSSVLNVFVVVCGRQREAYPSVEAHFRNITPYGSIFLVAAAQRVAVEAALSQRPLKSRAFHLIHVDGANSYRCTSNSDPSEFTAAASTPYNYCKSLLLKR